MSNMKHFILFILLLTITALAEDNLHAIKGGLLAHATGPVSSGKEDGTDLHLELLFKKKLLKAYPALGADINLNGHTSFLYTGLVWEGKFFSYLHLGAFFGLAVHNGELDEGSESSRQLGTRVLFREALDIGVYLQENLVLSLMYDHYSNVGFEGKRNQGNDNMGLVLSYYF